MKILLPFFFITFFSVIGNAQNTDSYTIQRLIIFNDQGEILLEQHKNGWMTPALRHNTKTGVNEGLHHLASEFGLTISTPRLAGVFMFIPEYKPESSFRQHYTCKLVDGELQLPESKLDAQWLSPHKAIDMMSLSDTKLIFAIRDMTKQVLLYPEVIWGGTFDLWKEEDKTMYKISEHFYPMADVR